MAGEDGIPPWVSFLTEEMNRRFDGLESKIAHLVTRDTFRDEQQRVNLEFRRQDREMAEIKAELKAESTARAAAELANAQSARASAEKANQVQKQTNWQWFLVIAGPVVAYLVGWVGAGGLAR